MSALHTEAAVNRGNRMLGLDPETPQYEKHNVEQRLQGAIADLLAVAEDWEIDVAELIDFAKKLHEADVML